MKKLLSGVLVSSLMLGSISQFVIAQEAESPKSEENVNTNPAKDTGSNDSGTATPQPDNTGTDQNQSGEESGNQSGETPNSDNNPSETDKQDGGQSGDKGDQKDKKEGETSTQDGEKNPSKDDNKGDKDGNQQNDNNDSKEGDKNGQSDKKDPSDDKKEDQGKKPAPKTPTPSQSTTQQPPAYYVPGARRPSHNPDDYKPVQPTPQEPVESEITEATEANEADIEVKEEINLLEGNFIAFNANIFEDEAEADEFIEMLESDEATKDRFVAEKEDLEDGLILVRVTYQDDLPYIYDEVGQPILFYVATAFDSQEEAEAYMEENLHTFPDIFFQGEVLEVDDQFDVLFGLQTSIDTQSVTYDEDSFEIDYLADREDFFYYVYMDEDGTFTDPIPEAVEERFPGMFEFETEDVSDSKQKVTATALEQESTEESEDQEVSEEIDQNEQEEDSQQ